MVTTNTDDKTIKLSQWSRKADRILPLDLARLGLHNKELIRADCRPLQEGFQERCVMLHIQSLTHKVVEEAESLLLTYGVRTGLRILDLLHAAAFVLVAEINWYFVAADQNLCSVIVDLGFSVF